jgi:Icc-related predicted phosphoesterase
MQWFTKSQQQPNVYSFVVYTVPQHGSWKTGFNKDSQDLKDHWKETLPNNVDVLVTHTPCKGVGDLEPWGHAVGCPHLLDEVARVKPKFHVCGHIHSDFGVHQVLLFRGHFLPAV